MNFSTTFYYKINNNDVYYYDKIYNWLFLEGKIEVDVYYEVYDEDVMIIIMVMIMLWY